MPLYGDRLVIRSLAPPDTLGGGVVLDPSPRRHGPSRDLLVRLARLERGEPEPEAPAEPDTARPRALAPTTTRRSKPGSGRGLRAAARRRARLARRSSPP